MTSSIFILLINALNKVELLLFSVVLLSITALLMHDIERLAEYAMMQAETKVAASTTKYIQNMNFLSFCQKGSWQENCSSSRVNGSYEYVLKRKRREILIFFSELLLFLVVLTILCKKTSYVTRHMNFQLQFWISRQLR